MLGNIIRDLYPYMLKVQRDETGTISFNVLSLAGSAKMPTESQRVKKFHWWNRARLDRWCRFRMLGHRQSLEQIHGAYHVVVLVQPLA